MRVLFDQGVPSPLRELLPGCEVHTAYELGWTTLSNGELLAKAESQFDVFMTTDRNLQKQQNLAQRRIAILVLPTTSWPRLRNMAAEIASTLKALAPGQYKDMASR